MLRNLEDQFYQIHSYQNNPTMVFEILKSSSLVVRSNNKTLMDLAVEKAEKTGNWKVVDLLAKYVGTYYKGTGIHVGDNAGFGKALLAAITAGQVETAKLLLEAEAPQDLRNNQGYGGLHITVLNNDVEMGKLLSAYTTLRLMRDSQGQLPVMLALSLGLWEHVNYFINLEKYQVSAQKTVEYFIKAVKEKQYAIVSYLYESADQPELYVDEYGNTALHLAIMQQDEKMVDNFIDFMRNKNIDPLIAKNTFNQTAMDFAYYFQHNDIVSKLAEAKFQYEAKLFLQEALNKLKNQTWFVRDRLTWNQLRFGNVSWKEGMPGHLANILKKLNKQKDDTKIAETFNFIEKELEQLNLPDLHAQVLQFNQFLNQRMQEILLQKEQLLAGSSCTLTPAELPLDSNIQYVLYYLETGTIEPIDFNMLNALILQQTSGVPLSVDYRQSSNYTTTNNLMTQYIRDTSKHTRLFTEESPPYSKVSTKQEFTLGYR